jgi:hypothetical protein
MIFILIPVLLNVLRNSGIVTGIVVLGCLGAVMTTGLVSFARIQYSRLAYIDELFAGHKPQRMMALSYDLRVIFPYVEKRNIVWAGRFHALWMLPAVSKGLIPVAQQDAVIAQATEIVTQDLISWKPDYVVVDRRSDTPTLRGHEVKYIAWFSRSPEFVQAWSSYKLVNSTGTFEVWELQ